MHRLPFSGVRVILWATPEGMVRSHAGRPGGRLGIVASRTAKTSCHRFAESQRYAFDLKGGAETAEKAAVTTKHTKHAIPAPPGDSDPQSSRATNRTGI